MTTTTTAPKIIRSRAEIDAELARAREVVQAPAGSSEVDYSQGIIDTVAWLTGESDEAPQI